MAISDKKPLAVKPRVFISYSRKDGESFANELRLKLEAHNIPLWQDRVGMEGGRDWWLQIVEALDKVEFMVLVMTPQAMADTIDYIEKNYLYARRTVEGVTSAFKTNNGLFATFMHATSRANDPHLHTHTLTLNMTQTDAGFRAVFNDPIFKDQTLINYIYQSELARNVRSLGYAINNDAKGKWEIAGFSDQWVESFSTRSREIDEALEHTTGSDKENGAKKRDRAQKSSRAAKDLELTPEELKDRWQAKVRREEILESVEAAKSMQQNLSGRDLSARQYIRIAYEAIHENESTFTRQDAVKVALELSRGQYTVADIDLAFYEAVKDNELEYLKIHKNKKGLETIIYTSRQMRQTEQNIVKLFGTHKADL